MAQAATAAPSHVPSAGEIEKEKLKAQKYIKTVFQEIDEDQSGQISFEEFQFWWLQRRNEHHEFLHKHDETKLPQGDVLCELCPDNEDFNNTDKAQLEQIQRVFDIADTNRSGTISFDEFAVAFTQLLQQSIESASWQEQWDAQNETNYFYNTSVSTQSSATSHNSECCAAAKSRACLKLVFLHQTHESAWTVPNEEAIKFPPTHEGVQEIVMAKVSTQSSATSHNSECWSAAKSRACLKLVFLSRHDIAASEVHRSMSAISTALLSPSSIF